MMDDFDTIKYEKMKHCGVLYLDNAAIMILTCQFNWIQDFSLT